MPMNNDAAGAGKQRGNYIAPLRFHALTKFYDLAIRLGMNQERFKDRLIAQAAIAPGQRVLDLGCGTGTLAMQLKRRCAEAVVIGADVDARALAIANAKTARAGVRISFCRASVTDLPFASKSFDRLLSSLFFHHLTTALKRQTLAAARLLLRPTGELHVADWGPAQNVLMRAAFLSVQLLDGFANTNDNVQGRLPALIREAGFVDVREMGHEMTLFGSLSLYRAVVDDTSSER